MVSDAVTTLGSGVDGSVRRIETAYDGQGNPYLVTSYDAASGGSIVNQVERAFNGLGQMTTEWQEHSGAVNTSTSAKVQYAYSFNGSGSVNHSRLTSITYPDGYVLTYNYSSGLNDSISRLSSLSDSTGTLEAYSYMGLGTVVIRSHPQIDVDLTFVGTPGDAGDQYAGLDRFGRVVDQLWENTSTSTATDEFQYAYDMVSNRTSMTNGVNSAFDESYTYDDLNQLTGFSRGSHTQDFNYDAVGNFDSVTTDGGTAQTRSANAQNEITSISGATTPTYDSNGNMTGDETGKQFVYDAWNRLAEVKDSGGSTLETFGYDGLNRRVSTTASSTTTDLYYSADWQVLEEQVEAATTQRYVWSPVYVDAMVLRDRDTDGNGSLDERLWVQQDANWNVTALVNGSGAVVERYVYDPFGVQTVYNASWSSLGSSGYSWSSGYQGTFFDSVAGMNEMDRRWYSPTLGRWGTMDPILFEGGDVVLYRFVGNNPLNATDPSGLAEYPVFGPGSQNPYGAGSTGMSGGFGVSTTRPDRAQNLLNVLEGPGAGLGFVDFTVLAASVEQNWKYPLSRGEKELLQRISLGAYAKHPGIAPLEKAAKAALEANNKLEIPAFWLSPPNPRSNLQIYGQNGMTGGSSCGRPNPDLTDARKNVDKLITELGDGAFKIREQAFAQLHALLRSSLANRDQATFSLLMTQLKAALKSQDPEVQGSAKKLLGHATIAPFAK